MHLQRLGVVLVRILEFNANSNIPCLYRRDQSRKNHQIIMEKQEPVLCWPRSNFLPDTFSFVPLCVHFRCPLVSIKGGKVFQGEDCQLSFKIKEGRETDGEEKAGWFPIWS